MNRTNYINNGFLLAGLSCLCRREKLISHSPVNHSPVTGVTGAAARDEAYCPAIASSIAFLTVSTAGDCGIFV